MEWTDSAQNELERILNRIRTSLDPSEVDIEEVTGDIRDRIEAELVSGNGHTVTAANVRAAAIRIGVEDLVAEEPETDPHKQAFEHGLNKPRRIRKRLGAAWFWFSGIILPLIALGLELFMHACLDMGLADPLPTPFHALLIALVPLSSFLGWQFLRNRKSLPESWLGLLLGIATTIAFYYALMFITIAPFALIGLAAIIYFGIGLLCFLPLAPLLSLITLLRLHVALTQHAGHRLPFFKRGVLLGLLTILLSSAPMYLTKAGLTMASSSNPSTQTRGIRILRATGDEVLMNRACYWGVNMPSDPISWLINRGQQVAPDQARNIYYRATGQAFNTKASPTFGIRSRRNPGDEYDWDPEQGGDVVAGRMRGLSLDESRIDGIVNADAATAYMEWTMVFRNEWSREREARAQIALPPGAVVSRLTLWIDGEEREAAFGGRSQVKQAYKKVVRRRRDPVLVTTYGPDRVLMQCYPVPANGEMKIRIGITAPLDCLSQADRSMRLPHLLERNFRMPEPVKHAVWIEDYLIAELTDTQLDSPEARIAATSSITTSFASDGDLSVVQEIRPSQEARPDHIALVLDTSVGMKNHIPEIAEAIQALQEEIPVTVWIADDGEPRAIAPKDLQKVRTGGGKDNAQALRKALTAAGKCVIWIHGPQEWDLGSSEILRQALERSHAKRIYDFQTGAGPNRLIEKMENLSDFHTVPRYGSVKTDLERLFGSVSGEHPTWQTVRMETHSKQTVPEEWGRGDSHLIRLYALDQIRADLADGKPGNETALQLALKHHLVTPVSGAVVLETQQQYEENDLQPVDSDNVPNVPEPGTLTLMLVAVLMIFYGKRIVRHIKSKGEIFA